VLCCGRCSPLAHTTTTSTTARSLLFTHTVTSLFGWCLPRPPGVVLHDKQSPEIGLLLVGWRLLRLSSLLFLGILCHPSHSLHFLHRKTTTPRGVAAIEATPQQQYSRNTQQRSGSRRPAKIRCVSMAPSQLFRARLAQAERGDIQAQAFVGTCYYLGKEGVTRDFALAFRFCRMAA
jgi:hypothetical protein